MRFYLNKASDKIIDFLNKNNYSALQSLKHMYKLNV